MNVTGKTFDAQVKRLYMIKAREIALKAKPVLKAQVLTASAKIAALVKDRALDADTHAVYVDEKELQYPVKVPGNRKPKPISSNFLLTLLDKGTKPHPIKHLNPAFALHFFKGSKEVFTRKTVNHPGTKAQNVWHTKEIFKETEKSVNERVKAIFA